MDCERFDKTTMELLYGELDELSEAAAMRHLHHCTRCRDIWGHLRTTRELAVLPQEVPPGELFSDIMRAEARAQKNLPPGERFSRAISVLAGYAMRPQLAMAALLLLMIGSSLIFVRGGPVGGENVAVTERGSPYLEPVEKKSRERPLVYDGESAVVPAAAPTKSDEGGQTQPPAREEVRVETRSTYAEAMTAYQDGRYAEAERLFSEVASAGGEQSASAALHEGHAARNGSGCQRAAPLYDSVAGNFPGGTVADEALWHAASCYRAMGQLSRARAHYNQLLDRPAFAARARSALQEISPAEPAVADVANSAEPDTSGSALALSDRSAVPAKKAESKPSAAETEAAAQDVAPAAPARAPAAVPSSKNTKSGK